MQFTNELCVQRITLSNKMLSNEKRNKDEENLNETVPFGYIWLNNKLWDIG